MARNYSNYDESDVRIRPGKGSRPRTKQRPHHDDARFGMVVSKDRGRWGVVIDSTHITCMRARELGRTPVVVGDRVGVVGDTSGKPGTLARIVKIEKRSSVLRRTADDTDPYERIVVANADQLLIVTALADPPPRAGFVERALIAAFVGGLSPILCLTKTDLANPDEFIQLFTDLDIPIITCGIHDPLDTILDRVYGHTTALIGHSGVGKSTLVNRLIPDADRATGEVSLVGKGRHTSTQSIALALPSRNITAPSSTQEPESSGWIIDTPGVRSFGLAHVHPEEILDVFEDLAAASELCPRGCTHHGAPTDPDCAWDNLEGHSHRRALAVRQLLIALNNLNDWEVEELRAP